MAEIVCETGHGRVNVVVRLYVESRKPFSETERDNDEYKATSRVSSACGQAAYTCKMAHF